MVVLLALAFILELVAFVGFAAIAFCLHYPVILQLIMAIALFVGLIVFWSFYMAPKAVKKFSPVYYYIAKVIIYAIATFAMFRLWGATFAIVFVILAIIDEATLYRHNLATSNRHPDNH